MGFKAQLTLGERVIYKVNSSVYKSKILCLRELTGGVPRSSVIGPKLFILYMNDICNVTEVLKLVFFADDTNLTCSV